MFKFISLAPLKYNEAVFKRFFDSISTRRHVLLDGTQVYSANAYLRGSLIPRWKEDNSLYANCDGSGTSIYKNEAIYKAISEGIERLAFYQNYRNEDLGFNIVPSTTGMAAFPGLFKSATKEIAFNEAVERWSLRQFWIGNLNVTKVTKKNEITSIHIDLPFRGNYLIIMFKDVSIHGIPRRVYGFAARSSMRSAYFSALVEMSRSFEALESIKDSSLSSSLNLMERRLIFFSKSEGIDVFNERLSAAKNMTGLKVLRPKKLIDTSIHGEWDDVCHVHRILFEDTESQSLALDEFSF